MNVLITGYLGFIGQHLMRYFKKVENVRKGGWIVQGIDLREGYDITKYFRGKYDVVVNCAGETHNLDMMVHTNVLGVESIVKQCQEYGGKLIHFSTSSINGSTYYGLTKRMGEEIIRAINPPNWCILRLVNVYERGGKGDSPACAFSRGDNVIFGDGYHIKDHVHVRDVVSAVELAIKDNWQGEVNLSSGKPATINEVFKRVSSGVPEYKLDKKPDMLVSYLDNSRALSLGWQPTWSIYDE